MTRTVLLVMAALLADPGATRAADCLRWLEDERSYTALRNIIVETDWGSEESAVAGVKRIKTEAGIPVEIQTGKREGENFFGIRFLPGKESTFGC